ncbi:Aste57867_8415 [Aphanomyces stellatus]|uniref:Aste57867_8415 protein n=1 Tax=Aphanomyces stellatus TaxID=120398 RepID=A0A485KK93_9STRA|nr:hypothetical protein As57867_008383 [Aphanomyces stellatus]VFT85301.1 Aste57867_8415 [Aphanomyces stellatus]
MGNEHSHQHAQNPILRTGSSGNFADKRLRSPEHYCGLPFVVWQGTHHFAEPSSYKYSNKNVQVQGQVVFVDPVKADNELRNGSDLTGNIAVVERGGRVHFPDIIRRLLKAGVSGCIFIEREAYLGPKMLFEGFHSSGRQMVDIPIIRLSKFHADQFLTAKPSKVTIEFLRGQTAVENLVDDDIPFGIATASRLGETSVLRSLLQSGQGKFTIRDIPLANALCDAAENGHVDCLEVLHSCGISLDEHKPNGTTPLMVACSVGNIEVARALIMFGANIDAEDVHDHTALMIAARDGSDTCLKYLIRKGAGINLSRNRKRGTTALHNAARSGREDCLSILIDAKAELDMPSTNSTTALMEAARAGNLGAVKLLADAGASLIAKDREGNTAETIAMQAGHSAVEDYLHERAENDSVKDQRRHIEEAIGAPGFSLMDLIELSDSEGVGIDILKREVIRNPKMVVWLEEPRVVFDVLKLLTAPPSPIMDPVYGQYKVQHFCCEVAMWYDIHVFERRGSVDRDICVGYFKVLFNFLCRSGPLDQVLVVLFCKVVNFYVNNRFLGPSMLYFLGTESPHIVPWLVCHIGLDSIRDTLVWILYSDLTSDGQMHLMQSGFFGCMFDRLYSWQRTLSWGVGSAYQRDSVENICSLMKYIIFPPSVYDPAVFVENNDFSLPLITARTPSGLQNELLRTLLVHMGRTDNALSVLLDLGYAELARQVNDPTTKFALQEGGALSVLMMLMSTLGYHKKKRDTSSIESLLRDTQTDLTAVLLPRVASVVQLCRDFVAKKDTTGNTLLCIVTFLKRCVFLQHGGLNSSLAEAGCMSVLMTCFESNPSNSMLHHEITDIIRFVLLDPDQKRLPSCPLLNSLFLPLSSLLHFVMKSYHSRVQYKGHMTTIANSIFTLINTPVYKDKTSITCQEVVRQYTLEIPEWAEFETVLAHQNAVEMTPLGQRHAPLCSGCINLKDSAAAYVSSTLGNIERLSGYLETIFSGGANFHCKVNITEDFITGFLYKKDKIHDHIPIPEPTRVSSFMQFPVPMPFHALTFTLTYVGLCRKCDKLWYCDTLHTGISNWTTRMKWVIPTSVRKWYSFGTAAGPGGGAHGIQFSTKGYKNFLVLTDTWGRQEQWIHALEDAIEASLTNAHVSTANALAIEIDNDADNSSIDTMKPTENAAGDVTGRLRAQTVGEKSKELDLKMFQKSLTCDPVLKRQPPPHQLHRLPPRFQSDPNETLMKEPRSAIRHVASLPNLAAYEKQFGKSH